MAPGACRNKANLWTVSADSVRVVMFVHDDRPEGVQKLADQNRQARWTREEEVGFRKADIPTAGFLDCFDDNVRGIGSLAGA
jgi:hypothetical protein